MIDINKLIEEEGAKDIAPVILSIYEQETGSGRNVRTSTDGARGPLQVMPATFREVMGKDDTGDPVEQARAGIRYAKLLGQRFGNDPAKIAAGYFSGPGNVPADPGVAFKVDRADGNGKKVSSYVNDVMRRLGQAAPAGQPASLPAQSLSDVVLSGIDASGRQANIRTGEQQADAAQAKRDAAAAKADATTFGDLFQTALGDGRVMSYNLLDRLFGDSLDQQVPASWDYWGQREQIIKGLSDEEVELLDEWGVKGPEHLERAKAMIQMGRDNDAVYRDGGGFRSFLAQLSAGMLDPASWAVGLGLGKAVQVAKISSAALAAAGRPGAAVAAMVGENVVAELAVAAADDMAGGQYTLGDYAFAATGAAALSAPFVRGTYRSANEAAIARLAEQTQQRAVDLDPPVAPELKQQRLAEQTAEIRKDFDGKLTEVPVIPDSVRAEIEADYTGRKATEPGAIQSSEFDPGDTLPALPEITFDLPPTVREEGELLMQSLESLHKQGDYATTTSQLKAFLARSDWSNIDDETYNALWPSMERLLAEARLVTRGGEAEPLVGTIDGAPITMSIDNIDKKQARDFKQFKVGGLVLRETTLGEVLKAVSRSQNANDWGHRKLAKHLLSRLQSFGEQGTLDIPVVFKRGFERGLYSSFGAIKLPESADTTDGVNPLNTPDVPLHTVVSRMSQWGIDTALHEIMHAVTKSMTDTWRVNPSSLAPELRFAMDRLEALRLKLSDKFAEAEEGPGYAAKNIDEFIAMAMTDARTIRALSKMPASPSFGGRLTSAFKEVIEHIKTLVLGPRPRRNPSAYDEAAWAIEVMLEFRGGGTVDEGGRPVPGWVAMQQPTPSAAPPVNPTATVGAVRKWAQAMYQHAADYLQANPIDTARLDVGTKFIGSVSDGLKLAASKNPILRMVAGVITETTTGAAGRRSTVAIRKELLQRKLTGNTLIDFDAAYRGWRRRNNLSWVDDFTAGENRRKFDRAVSLEILARRASNTSHPEPEVKAAADALEALYERARVAQKDAKILGADWLPETSRGYFPQALDGRKLAETDPAHIRELEQALGNHWANVLGWDPKFAGQFAQFYVDRARGRAMRRKGVEVAPGGGDSAAVIRDTLEAMKEVQTDPVAVSQTLRAIAALNERGVGQTRKRLDVPMDLQLPNGKLVLDFYDDNMLDLARRYVNRTAGNVALTEFGVHGARGVRALFDAAINPPDAGMAPTDDELEAFRRVTQEILGEPIDVADGYVHSRAASNLRIFVGLQRLGSLAFTQAAETVQLLHHLGVGAVLKAIPGIPRMMGEVGRLKRGQASGNHILTSIEAWGGEIGMDSFKLVMPLDPPDGRVGTYVDDSGIFSKLLQAGSHAQSKVSFFRAIMAAQHRFTAEQITMRAARFIRDTQVLDDGTMVGPNSAALRDMGFTPELVAALRTRIDQMAQWDSNGRLIAFDVTKAPTPVAAEAFVQAVHRGVSQIIQGTFVGERTKWMHNDYAQLLLQLRTFGVTAAEKQWARTRFNHGGGIIGYSAAAGMLVAQAALVLPIHLARIQLAAGGREDAEEYIEKNMKPEALVRAVMNYTALSGLMGDILDVSASVASGWGLIDSDVLGGRQGGNALSVSGIVPAAASVDLAAKGITGDLNAYTAMKQLPFSNLPYIIPILNQFR